MTLPIHFLQINTQKQIIQMIGKFASIMQNDIEKQAKRLCRTWRYIVKKTDMSRNA